MRTLRCVVREGTQYGIADAFRRDTPRITQELLTVKQTADILARGFLETLAAFLPSQLQYMKRG